MDSACRDRLRRILAVPPQFDEPLAHHTTMRVGGRAAAFVTVSNVLELKRVLGCSREAGVRIYVLGNGSNVLFTAKWFDGIVLRLGQPFESFFAHDRKVAAGGALLLSTLARRTAALGLSGLEFAGGIPGTVGGSLTGNAGAYRESLSDSLTFVDLMDPDGEIRRCCRQELGFGYRCSNLQERRSIVLRAHFCLTPTSPQAARDKMETLNRKRAQTQPLQWPSAGCVFKNPTRPAECQESSQVLTAAALIEKTGLKGLRVGDAEVSTMHANFIINRGSATSDDVLTLIEQVRSRVREETGVNLELEVQIVA